ncbi:MAG: hypothetical protein NC293_13625 [Roseburia sp.]|nr:hypothetical protein [Roseburia sp.]
MRKIRRFLTVLLFINFFAGMAQGMKIWNVTLITVNALPVIVLAVKEIKKGRKNL